MPLPPAPAKRAALLSLEKRGLKSRDIITDKALANAMVVHAAFGGSTNLLLHIPAGGAEGHEQASVLERDGRGIGGVGLARPERAAEHALPVGRGWPGEGARRWHIATLASLR